jgi:integrase
VAAMPTIAQRTIHLQMWRTELGGHVQRREITAADIRAVLQRWRADGLEPATCNKRRTALMHLWSMLDGKGAANPVRDVRKMRAADPLPRGRDPHLIDAKLKARTPSRTRACCRVMLWTGMRPDELAKAQPDDIDLTNGAAIIRTAKGGRTRVVPLTSQAIEAWREFEDAECWGNVPQAAPMNRLLKIWTGMPELRVYDLRHSYGTALAMRETRLDVIGSLMGHSTLELTKRYTLAAVTPDAASATIRLARKA